MQPSVRKLVLYLWLTTFVLLVLFSVLKQLLGTTHMFAGEYLWLAIAPLIVGALYRKKYKQILPEETARRVANYFVASVILVGLVAIYLSTSAKTPLRGCQSNLRSLSWPRQSTLESFGFWVAGLLQRRLGLTTMAVIQKKNLNRAAHPDAREAAFFFSTSQSRA